MHKRECVERAQTLLDSAKESDLPYAALELRFAIETIVYEKLRFYAPRLPVKVLEKWQPPQAMKALLQLEPRAGSEKIIRFREEKADGPSEWHSLGKHLTFNIDWLSKNYNKLGGYLHAPSIQTSDNQQSADAVKKRTALQQILTEVARVAASQTDSTLANVTEIPCQVCGKPILCNVDGLSANLGAGQKLRVSCLDPACSAEHILVKHDDDLYYPNIDGTGFDCVKCKAVTIIEHRKLKIGLTFQCSACKTEHSILNKQWKYGARVDGGQSEEQDSPLELSESDEPKIQ